MFYSYRLFSLRRLLAYRTKRGFSLPAVLCFMSQVSKLAVRESDSSRSLRGAKPVRVSLACGVMGETGTLTLQISLQSLSYGIPRYTER